VPVSLVTLVDEERQWFKSCIGSDIHETSREVSFCAHAIQKRDVMIVNDALLDNRFADNPLVISGPHVRFYAGAPLFVGGRHCVGTLCILDTRPRHFSEEEARLLADLGKMVEQELEKQSGKVEARAGIEPACKDLQSSA
jgi:GAF domain-containing protein